MLKIAICTQRTDFENYIEDLLSGILCEYSDWTIEKVPVQVLMEQRRETFSDYHVFCLDEQLLKQKGIGPVRYLSRVRPDASIIILEGLEEQGITGIRYHLFAYQMKRMKQSDLETELSWQWQQANSTPRCLSVEIDGDPVAIPLEQIMYIESCNRRIILHTMMGNYEYYEKMYVLEELLNEDEFIRCHQSYMVSKRFVTDYNSLEIRMDEIVIPIGRKYKEEVYRAFSSGKKDSSDESNKSSEKQGVLVCINGANKGATIHFRPEQRILVGRDEKVADVVVNAPKVSRLHCVIIFHENDNTYEIVDFSKNGTYISEKQRLVSDMSYCVKAGTQICFGDGDVVYCLG